MYADESELPEWFRETLRDDVELAFNGGKYVGTGHVIVAVKGSSWAFGGFAKRLLDMPQIAKLNEEHVVHWSRIEFGDGDLNDVETYALRMSNMTLVAMRYFGLVCRLYPEVDWFCDNSDAHDPLVAKIDDQIVAVVMPLRGV